MGLGAAPPPHRVVGQTDPLPPIGYGYTVEEQSPGSGRAPSATSANRAQQTLKPPLDDDNMVKPIRDALNQLVYDDDRQIRYSEIIQVSIDAPVKIRKGSKILLEELVRL